LRPLDLIQPYRLEMGTALHTRRGSNLYAYWGDTLTAALAQDMSEARSSTLVNLASQEYFKSIRTKRLDARLITPVFQDEGARGYAVVSFFAKRARGLMARYLIENRLSQAEALKDFSAEGYAYSADTSSDDVWVFRRSEISLLKQSAASPR
jgi:hypothetical protein